jgi:endonuclease YncB( thermonuclease family)
VDAPTIPPRAWVPVLRSVLPRLVGVALLLASALPAVALDLVGRASIVDGDTLDIRGERIRLWGIDAPESAQLCRGRDRNPTAAAL